MFVQLNFCYKSQSGKIKVLLISFNPENIYYTLINVVPKKQTEIVRLLFQTHFKDFDSPFMPKSLSLGIVFIT